MAVLIMLSVPHTHGWIMNYKLLRKKLVIVLHFLYVAQQPPVGQGLLIYEVSRSHTTTHHSR